MPILSLKESIFCRKGQGLNTELAVISKYRHGTNGKREHSIQLRCAHQEVIDPESRLLANTEHGRFWARVSCEKLEIQTYVNFVFCCFGMEFHYSGFDLMRMLSVALEQKQKCFLLKQSQEYCFNKELQSKL